MRDIIARTTEDSDIISLSEQISDKDLILFLAKTQFTYPEYKHRLSTAKANAISEAKVNKYSDGYTKAFIHYRVEMEKYDINRDMRSAFELLSAKLRFKNPAILSSSSFLKLELQIRNLARGGFYLEDC